MAYNPDYDPTLLAYEAALENGDYRTALAIQVGMMQAIADQKQQEMIAYQTAISGGQVDETQPIEPEDASDLDAEIDQLLQERVAKIADENRKAQEAAIKQQILDAGTDSYDRMMRGTRTKDQQLDEAIAAARGDR